MKTYFYSLLAMILFIVTNSFATTPPGKTSLSGKITDKQTGEPIPGVTLYIPDLKTGAVSDAEGKFRINQLPQTTILLQITAIGYLTIVEKIDLNQITTKDFVLEVSAKEINEVVVTGLSQAAEMNRTPTPISLVTKTQLLQNSSTNIIDALAKQPGISQITTGSGISKPVIRGLGYNRVVVVKDGIRQEGQQWGDEHGIEMDEFSVSRIEILKGPASLSYGSDAIAGVINMLGAPTLPEGMIEGNVLANYQSNNGLIAYSANVAGNLKGFIWDIRYSNKMAHAYQNRYDGYVLNSGFKENNFGGLIGFNHSRGYTHLQFSRYEMKPGIVEGDRDSATGKFIRPVVINDTTESEMIASENDLLSYSPFIPFQEISHYKAVLNNSLILGPGSLKANIGFQQNQRKEFGNVFFPSQYGLYFLLNTINYDLRYVFPEIKNISISAGVNGMQQSSKNKGSEFIVPEYDLFDIGVFMILKRSFKKLDISGGIRYDSRTFNSHDLYVDQDGLKSEVQDTTTSLRFDSFNRNFSGISGSLGATYQFSEKLFAKLNAARGYRSPNIAETGSNGEHEGTGRYEIGNPELKAENSLQLDAALGINTEHISAEIDVFSNRIDNYIFLKKLQSTGGGDSLTNGSSTFEYGAGDANLFGAEITIDIHPHPIHWLHIENSFSFVQATQKDQPDSSRYLPFIPAPKLQTELRADIKNMGNFFSNAYVKVELENYFSQNRFYSAYGTETATPGYTLFNLGLGTEITRKEKTLCSIFISINNITDVAYQSHLSRLKYAAVNNVTGRQGVYNMGRNISFKLLIPLQVKAERKVS
ncbi:MAG: TonB-dependent receptor [Bacteroidota bacterium]|nr:TonB-dependent receptor [Bacteroidota bacterium]